jgi:hypothetical protein
MKLYFKKTARQKVDATIIGIRSGANFISPLTLFELTNFLNTNFVVGRMEIDYANCLVKVSLFELYTDGESDINLGNYEFNYILDTK